jgi:hypothetical protein
MINNEPMMSIGVQCTVLMPQGLVSLFHPYKQKAPGSALLPGSKLLGPAAEAAMTADLIYSIEEGYGPPQ